MLGWQRPFSPSVPAEAGCLFTVAAGVHVFIPGESLHCFLVGWCTNKSYVIATSDLWFFIHASNLLSLNSPSPLPYTCIRVSYDINLGCLQCISSKERLEKEGLGPLSENAFFFLISIFCCCYNLFKSLPCRVRCQAACWRSG